MTDAGAAWLDEIIEWLEKRAKKIEALIAKIEGDSDETEIVPA